MEMVIRRLPETVDITLEKDDTRGDIDIKVDGYIVGYFTIGIRDPVLRISRGTLKERGFQFSIMED